MRVLAARASFVPAWRAAQLHPGGGAPERVDHLQQRQIPVVGQDDPPELARQGKPSDQGRTMTDPCAAV